MDNKDDGQIISRQAREPASDITRSRGPMYLRIDCPSVLVWGRTAGILWSVSDMLSTFKKASNDIHKPANLHMYNFWYKTSNIVQNIYISESGSTRLNHRSSTCEVNHNVSQMIAEKNTYDWPQSGKGQVIDLIISCHILC